MRVVIIGPGRIGCGFLAPVFLQAGWEVVLAARSSEAAERIRDVGRFEVRVTHRPSEGATGFPRPGTSVEVAPSAAVAVGDDRFGRAIRSADLVCTAVGVRNVRGLAPPLAEALEGRTRPLEVWTVENGECAPDLEASVRAEARRGVRLPGIRFSGAVATVAVSSGTWSDGVPVFVGDAARTLLVERGAENQPLPRLPGVVPTTRYPARLREKLYVFNAGHAICAYLGWLRGHATVADAAADPFLRPMLAGSMLEARRALLRREPELGNDVDGPVAEALDRFTDPELADPVERVARDPLRKLAAGDRLLGPVGLIREATGRVPAYFALGIAGALLYRAPDDPRAVELAGMLGAQGVMAVLREVCGLPDHDPFAQAVAERYRRFIFADDGCIFPPVHDGEAPVVSPRLAPLEAG